MAEERPKPPESAEELLRRYAAGERDFRYANLNGADLKGANLTRAYFSGAHLNGADLEGATLVRANFLGAELREANLSRAHLEGADLSDAHLDGANLSSVHLEGAHLTCTKFSGAHFNGAVLRGADLEGADLEGAHLVHANFNGANLRNTRLVHTTLRETNFGDADLSDTHLYNTVFSNLDISSFCDAGPHVWCIGSSVVDFDSIVRSLRSPNLKDFLVRTGVPELAAENMVDTAMALSHNVFDLMRSTFISYGHKDEAFARRLYEALHRNGVRVFYAPEHSRPGEKIHRELRKGIENHDRTILVCSQSSLDRPWVLHEIELALDREAGMRGESLLIPITLDDYVFDGWNPPQQDHATAVRDRVVANFRGADRDEEAFSRGLRRLLGALKKTPDPVAVWGQGGTGG